MSIEVNPADIPKEELYNLDHTLAAYILPRLVAFRTSDDAALPPGSYGGKTFGGAVDKMILAFRGILDEFEAMDGEEDRDPLATQEEIEEGLSLFATWFRSLWT